MSTCPTCRQVIKRTRNLEQNAIYWKLLQLISQSLRPLGVTYIPDTYHEYYRRKFLTPTEVSLPNGLTIRRYPSTTELSVEEFSDYFDAVQEDARDRGVILPIERGEKPW